jgi:site-specific recombinase XerD
MATEELMTFSGGRWVKNYTAKDGKYKQIRVSIKQLRQAYPNMQIGDTKTGSVKAANKWWDDKLAELESTPIAIQPEIDRLMKIASFAETTGDMEQSDEIISRVETVRRLEEIGYPDAKAFADLFLRQSAPAEVQMLQQEKKTVAGNDCQSLAKKWLDKKMDQVEGEKRTAGHVQNMSYELNYFLTWFDPNKTKSVTEINGLTYDDFHQHLDNQITVGKFKEASAKRFQGTFKSWVKWLYEIEKLELLPRNFTRKDMTFKVPDSEPVPWTKEEIHNVLSVVEGKVFECWVYVMLNCAFTQIDLSELEQSQVDWQAGTITSQRGKTSNKSDNVPCVTFPLWPKTFQLLKNFRSKDRQFVFLNTEGKQLVRDGFDEKGKYKKQDVVQSQYYDVKLKMKEKFPEWEPKQLKQLRKTGPSLLAGNPQFATLDQIFLRHAPTTISERHYKAVPAKLIYDAVLWIGQELKLV